MILIIFAVEDIYQQLDTVEMLKQYRTTDNILYGRFAFQLLFILVYLQMLSGK